MSLILKVILISWRKPVWNGSDHRVKPGSKIYLIDNGHSMILHGTETEANWKGRRDGRTLPTSLAAISVPLPKAYIEPRLRSGGALPPCCPFPFASGAVLCILRKTT